MKLIAHRGNLFGPDRDKENHPDLINAAVASGYDVEVDVWNIDGTWALGHDRPEYEVDLEYLINESFWCHAKNLNALGSMLYNDIRCFWHQEDNFTLTSDNVIWTYPHMPVTRKSVIVCQTWQDTVNYAKTGPFGICSDYVGKLTK